MPFYLPPKAARFHNAFRPVEEPLHACYCQDGKAQVLSFHPDKHSRRLAHSADRDVCGDVCGELRLGSPASHLLDLLHGGVGFVSHHLADHHHSGDVPHPQADPGVLHGLGRLHDRHGHDGVALHILLHGDVRQLLHLPEVHLGLDGHDPLGGVLRAILRGDVQRQMRCDTLCDISGCASRLH